MYKLPCFIFIICICGSFQKSSNFIATEEWQEIKPDQSIPRGLHVRMNLATGKKEAKILDEKNSSNREQGLIHIVEPTTAEEKGEHNDIEETNGHKDPDRLMKMKELVKALKNIPNDFIEKEEIERVKKFRNIKELKDDLADLNLSLNQGPSLVPNLIKEFSSATSDLHKIEILKDFEYLLHEGDAANDFSKLDGASLVIIPGLNSTSVEIQQITMSVIGAAAQSNPVVQVNFIKHQILWHLMTSLTNKYMISGQIRCLYGISSLIRGFPYGQKKFIQLGGLTTLLELFLKNSTEAILVQVKVITLIRNLLEEKVYAIGERAVQLKEVNIDLHLIESGWCPAIGYMLNLFTHRKQSNSHNSIGLNYVYDILNPVIDIMNMLVPYCKLDFQVYSEKLENMATFLKEEHFVDDNISQLRNQVLDLLKNLKIKDEL